MAKQSQTEIDQMIQRSQCKNRDLVRRDIIRVIQSSSCSLILNLVPYFTNDGTSKEYLCLTGTVICQYRGNRYNIPIEINLSDNHPYEKPSCKVKPTSNMYISPANKDVQADGTIISQYLQTWRHPNSDLNNLINSMSYSFSQSPPLYSSSSNPTATSSSSYSAYPSSTSNPTTTPYPSYPSNINQTSTYPSYPPYMNQTPSSYSSSYPTNTNQTTTSYPPYPTNINQTPYYPPYPTNTSAMPMPTPLNTNSYASSNVYPSNGSQNTGDISEDVYRESLRTGVLDKIRRKYYEINDINKGEMSGLNKTQQDLDEGFNQVNQFIDAIHQQQNQIQNYITSLKKKTNEKSEKASSLEEQDKSIKDDAILIKSPVYKQIFECLIEDHAIEDLLFYLGDGLRRRSISLESYLKHVRELSRKQFLLRATIIKCRQAVE